MEHLSGEALARLVDWTPEPEEAEHLTTCATCASELDALRTQTEDLRSLPALLPPKGDWDVLEARLRSEGLVRDPGLFGRLGFAGTPAWMRAAAAVALFLGGTAVGAAVTARGTGTRLAAVEGAAAHPTGVSLSPNGVSATSASSPAGPAATQTSASSRANVQGTASPADVQQAAENLQTAEQTYVNALARYREMVADGGTGAPQTDPRSQFAALEYLVAASQAAVRQAPADPFLNGVLASTLAERQAVLRRISSQNGNWF